MAAWRCMAVHWLCHRVCNSDSSHVPLAPSARVIVSNLMISTLTSNQPHSQRRRDGCSECRRKKVKCDLRKPVCSRCARYPRGCIYTLSVNFVSPQPRTRSPDQATDLSILANQPTLTLSPFLSSAESKFFMHVLATQTAPVFFPAAPKLFVDRLISAALDTPHLLYALLASACSHHGRLIGDNSGTSWTACLKFTNLAISGLNSALNEPTQMLQAETAMTAMTLCTNDVCNGNMNVWQMHLAGVMRLLTAFLKQPSNMADSFTLCLVKWFTTLDVLAGVSSSTSITHGLLEHFLETRPSEVDDICGYSLELVPALTRIGQLARQDTLSHQDMYEAQMLDLTIHSLVDRDVPSSTLNTHGPELAHELQYTHLAFVHSALLHLHRCVQGFPRDHPDVCADIHNIVAAIQHIRPFSQANILILWPVFSAGCETTVPEERDLIHTRMTNMRSLGMGNFTRARDMLEAFWAAASPLPWNVYFAQKGLELVLF
ncbi:hypothetical protein BO94DRAFT_545618 [Aspergillus sclerotioniger CBS 115572]|uniref:Zn(2)-C6 fungal-type domain-containing protein n=1 Tax=Aspergillus sclerotioniger CBS 115572 TaxID=1450535 RepID=A0A317WTG9_9EURO|nr:hypothetical protein BO94DRAFT_545618 [Aspergillus sclerotioniger CBS 115572]PWY89646.1 hypothetical protein BO94DRAFT_545618 [Aspergillus sclerotioniger CBS 115572]